jgi:hypothetical protein
MRTSRSRLLSSRLRREVSNKLRIALKNPRPDGACKAFRAANVGCYRRHSS